MDRIYASGAAGSAPSVPASPSSGYPTGGNPGTGTPATKPGPYWYHMVMEELMAIITAGGITPAPGTLNQVKQALDNLYQAKGSAGLPTGYKFGLVLANNSTNPTTQIDFGAGKARSYADNYDLVLAATMTKTLQASGAWAAGSGSNGLFSGVKANSTWYHCFIIRKDADGSIDAGFDTSFTAANKPAGYSNYRRVGSVKTDSSGNIIAFLHDGKNFTWKTPIVDVAVTGGPAANTPTLYTLSVPPGIAVEANVCAQMSAGNSYMSVNCPDCTAPTITTYSNAGAWLLGYTNSTPDAMGSFLKVMTNTSSQIRVTTFADAQSIDRTSVTTVGWAEIN